MRIVLAALAALLVAVSLSTPAAAVPNRQEVLGQTLADSLGTAADTLRVPSAGEWHLGRLAGDRIEAMADSQTVVILQVWNGTAAADSLKRWFEAARDTVPAGGWVSMDIPAGAKGKYWRLILDNLTAGASYGDADVVTD